KDWVHQFGLEETTKICETNLLPPQSSARVNIMKASVQQLVSQLEYVDVGQLSKDAIIFQHGNIANTEEFKKGLISIQDESSMLVARALDIKQEQYILDSCAAPGGKTTHIAECLQDTGRVFSFDLHKHKVKLIKQQVERLGLSNVDVKVAD